MPTPTRWPYKHAVSKDPDATLDYTVDWSDWLAEGEEIVNSSWTLDGVISVNASFTTTTATLFVSGGTNETIASMTNRITTNNTIPRIDERTILLPIRHR